MTRIGLALLLALLAAPAVAKGHGGGHGGGGHGAVSMCAGCKHEKLCRFEELVALKAACFGLAAPAAPKPGEVERRP